MTSFRLAYRIPFKTLMSCVMSASVRPSAPPCSPTKRFCEHVAASSFLPARKWETGGRDGGRCQTRPQWFHSISQPIKRRSDVVNNTSGVCTGQRMRRRKHPLSTEAAELTGHTVTSQQPLGETPHDKATGCSEGDAALIVYHPVSRKKGSHVPPK